MAARNLLAFDLGAESGRALLGRLEGGKITLEEKHRFANPNGRINGHLCWNLLAQWEELKTGLRKAAAGGDAIHAIGVDTWGVDVGFLDKDGDVVASPYMYRDPQTDGMMDLAFARVPRAEMFERTGVQFMQLNTVFHLLAMARRKSAILDAARTMLFMPDLFNYLFTGEKVAEFSIATTSQMYDPRARTWATGMLDKLGIPTHFLPKIVPTGTRLASVRSDVARECGITADIPVIATAGHDTAAAVAAVPVDAADGPDWCYISSGTWSLMGVEVREPIINPKSLALNYTNEGGVGGTIRFLKNIMGLWLVQECRRQWVKEGRELTYAELTRMAAESDPFIAAVNPDDRPFITPGEMPRKIAEFCTRTNQRAPGTPGEYVRVCLESLALTYRKTIDGLEDVLGRKINVIHIVGGGTQNELLSQMTADATGKLVVAGPVEATAVGNMGVTAMAAGEIGSVEELRAIVRRSFPVKRYEPTKDRGGWDEAYGNYTRLRV
ncbi:MAG: rhamnulokinase family protein [Phycisphaerae bacterium]|nr:rhamnulokinase family protein [Tepidisphaeraceae bacterium]